MSHLFTPLIIVNLSAGDIAKYLFQQYGGNRSPSFGILERYLSLVLQLSLFWNNVLKFGTCLSHLLLFFSFRTFLYSIISHIGDLATRSSTYLLAYIL